jgi:hypothetical protein
MKPPNISGDFIKKIIIIFLDFIDLISVYCDRCPTFQLPAMHPEALDGYPDNMYSYRTLFSQKTQSSPFLQTPSFS